MTDADRRHVSMLAAPIFAALVGAHSVRGRLVDAGELAGFRRLALDEAAELWRQMLEDDGVVEDKGEKK